MTFQFPPRVTLFFTHEISSARRENIPPLFSGFWENRSNLMKMPSNLKLSLSQTHTFRQSRTIRRHLIENTFFFHITTSLRVARAHLGRNRITLITIRVNPNKFRKRAPLVRSPNGFLLADRWRNEFRRFAGRSDSRSTVVLDVFARRRRLQVDSHLTLNRTGQLGERFVDRGVG